MTAHERASRGGKARAAALTPEQRSESARRAVQARWAKVGQDPTVVITVGPGARPEVTTVVLTRGVYVGAEIVTRDATWSLTSHSFVITPKGPDQSYTQ